MDEPVRLAAASREAPLDRDASAAASTAAPDPAEVEQSALPAADRPTAARPADAARSALQASKRALLDEAVRGALAWARLESLTLLLLA